LGQLLENLIKPVSVINDPLLIQQLEKLRASIDDIDFEVIELLSERMELVREIGQYKKSKQITILQIERWAEIFKSRQANAEQLQIDKSFIENIMNAIHQESIRQQAKIMNQTSIIEKVDKK
jgi:chorismate mutase